MKGIIILFFAAALFIFTQTGMAQNKTTDVNQVSPEMKQCIDNIYQDNLALKTLVTRVMKDEKRRKELYETYKNDPEIKSLMDNMKKDHQDMLNNNMTDDKNKMDPHHNIDGSKMNDKK